MKNKKIILFGLAILIVVIIILGLMSIIRKSNTITCSINNNLIDGFDHEETVTVRLGSKKIKNIQLDKTVKINDFYKEYGTYTETLKKLLGNGYKDLKYDLKKTDDAVNIKLDINDGGIVLNNITIKNNSENENTSLIFDIETNNKDERAVNIGDKYTKNDLKNKLKKLGYSC